jgi:hypothetical protein
MTRAKWAFGPGAPFRHQPERTDGDPTRSGVLSHCRIACEPDGLLRVRGRSDPVSPLPKAEQDLCSIAQAYRDAFGQDEEFARLAFIRKRKPGGK